MTVHGLLLAAGAGRRYGVPKALVRDPDGSSWLLRAVAALAPCDAVTVVLGAAGDEAAALLPPSVQRVVALDWAEGMGASLRAGLTRLAETGDDVALVHLVDLPDVDAAVVARVIGAAAGAGPRVLARATYDGAPGHPVLIGRDHWAGVIAGAVGESGARDYLAEHPHRLVECGDLAGGGDVDAPAEGLPTGAPPCQPAG